MALLLLSVKDLSVAFRSDGQTTLAVDKVSFDIRPGETVALVGESGSGKSVSALSILQLLPTSASHPSGSIIYDGKQMIGADEPTLREVRGDDIAIIFQEPMTSLNPLHTIERQLAEILSVHKGLSGSKARARILDLLNKVGIVDPARRLGAYPHQLSGGQRQRVMIAMALANEPKILIADEPTTALDVTVQAQILVLLKELRAEEGMAMLLITHDLGIVRKMASQVHVMQGGKIVEAGETEAIFTEPRHAYTKHLIQSEPSGEPNQAKPGAPVVIEGRDVKVWFPIKRGVLRRIVGHVKAVDGIDITVRQGQTVGVVGESGSGKTTLGLGLLRLIKSEGEIAYLGKAINGLGFKTMRPLRREMQVVFQDPYGSLSPRMSIGQIVAEGLEIHGIAPNPDERRALVGQTLEEVGLSADLQDRYPHEFSGGQRQRIAVARAMVLKPKLVVLDEPTSALDMSVQSQIVDLLRKLQADHDLAYVFISHDLKVVRALSEFVIVMRQGKVVEIGTSDQIFDAPETDYTKALMAAAFDLEVRDAGGIEQ